MNQNKIQKFDKYNLLKVNSVEEISNILINEEIVVSSNNLILDCIDLKNKELEEAFPLLEKISLTLVKNEKTFIVLHSTFPTDKWDEVIVIPTLHESKEYVFMEELTRGF